MAEQVAELYATLGLKVNASNWAQAESMLRRVGRSMHGLEAPLKKTGGLLSGLGGLGLKGMGLGVIASAIGGVAGRGYDSLIKFNATVEDTRLQIAGMMALATKTDLNDNLAQADQTMGNLQRRAAKLPGTTAEYAQMLGALTQPILDAKLSMQDLEDITVGAVVSAKALGVQSEVAARDIDQAIRGQFHANDVLTGKLLGSVGFKGETGRARFNALDARKRAEALKQAITQKQIVQLGAAQGETFSGVLSTLQDSIQQFFAKAGLPLFKAITRVLKDWVEWLGKNEAKVRAVADAIGKGLMAAFTIVGNIVNALIDLFKEMWADEDIRAVIEAILGLIRALVKFLMKSENVKAIVKGMFLPLIGILKIVGYLINNVGGWFDWLDQKLIALGGAIVGIAVAIKDFFVGIGTAIRDFFGAVIDWIAAKIDWVKGKVSWVWDKAKSIANFVGGGVNIPDLMKTVQGATPAVGGAGTASRVVPPSGFAPPPVNLQAPTTVKIMGNIPADWIETTVDQRIRSDKEKTWRDVHAATGGEEQ